MKQRCFPALAVLILSLPRPEISRAAVTVEVGKETGLKTWEWRENGVSLRLVQRLPDQTRAYLLARGFDNASADLVARNCLFGSMFRNDGSQPLDFDLDRWEVLHQGKAMHMMTRERWKERLVKAGVSKAGRIAFNWSLMPTRQHFEPGDYNWGMTSYGLPPGSRFDLKLKLNLGGKPLEALIEGLECAPEKLRSSEEP
ncbi:MAG: hypothetical protein DSZ01_02670 [Gammaproteobacteria bacterium]|nr:MAG: hypothetical protein DSZ01_02670 [Gammaproteobacteria bacterium]